MARRARAAIAGGYVRKTLSLPAAVVEAVENALKPGETISMFMTAAAERETKRRS